MSLRLRGKAIFMEITLMAMKSITAIGTANMNLKMRRYKI
jgi:hypothetical protein